MDHSRTSQNSSEEEDKRALIVPENVCVLQHWEYDIFIRDMKTHRYSFCTNLAELYICPRISVLKNIWWSTPAPPLLRFARLW